MEEQQRVVPKTFDVDELNAFVNAGALPAREDDGPVLVTPGSARPWPRATEEELAAFAEQQWRQYRSKG
jgi:hypothetical protein